MKFGLATVVVLAGLGTMVAAGPVLAAGSDDAQWIRKCVADNKDEGQTAQTVQAYCACMVDLMPESETRSVTQWEKTHKKEENLCGAKAGWVGK